MQICLIDFETTGIDPMADRITEIGAAVAVFAKGFEGSPWGLGPAYQSLVWDPTYPAITPEVEEVTGINQKMLEENGVTFVHMVEGLVDFFSRQGWPDYFMAHNKAFDETIFKSQMKREKAGLVVKFGDPLMQQLFAVPWLCSIDDVEHPPRFTCKKLSHLALDYGVVFDATKLHRAMADVGLLFKLLDVGKIDLEKVVKRFKEPWIYIRAVVPSPFGKDGDNGKGKDKAKSSGYGWQKAPRTDAPEFKGWWVKRIKENELEGEKTKLDGYEVRIIGT